jgi:hypothetical protein
MTYKTYKHVTIINRDEKEEVHILGFKDKKLILGMDEIRLAKLAHDLNMWNDEENFANIILGIFERNDIEIIGEIAHDGIFAPLL